MSMIEQDLQTIAEELKKQRDLLVVKMHLAKAEIKDEWRDLEYKWAQFNARSDKLKQELTDTAEDVAEDLKALGEDLRQGYEHLKNTMK